VFAHQQPPLVEQESERLGMRLRRHQGREGGGSLQHGGVIRKGVPAMIPFFGPRAPPRSSGQGIGKPKIQSVFMQYGLSDVIAHFDY
jgi:hypothetical protein